MRVEIPAYLKSHLAVADRLPELLDECDMDTIEMLQRRIRELVELVAIKDLRIQKLEP